MARAPRSRTTPNTACTICCQQSETMLDSWEGWVPVGEESGSLIWGSAMSIEVASSELAPSCSVSVSRAGGRWGGWELGVGIFARLARVYYGTEGDVRAIGWGGQKPLTTRTRRGTKEDQRLWGLDP